MDIAAADDRGGRSTGRSRDSVDGRHEGAKERRRDSEASLRRAVVADSDGMAAEGVLKRRGAAEPWEQGRRRKVLEETPLLRWRSGRGPARGARSRRCSAQ